MKEGTENQNLKLFIVFLIGVLVGGFLLWMWTATQNELFDKVTQKEVTNDETVSEDQIATVRDFNATETQLHNDAIVVRNQALGLSVVVERAVLEEDGWVVIHEGTVSHIGNALGAARFDKGEHSGVVELLRTTEVGITYRAVLYRDNGDKEFNLDNDFPFLQSGNQPILTTFIVE